MGLSRRRFVAAAGLAAAGAAVSGFARPSDARPLEAWVNGAAFDDWVRSEMARQHVPGLSLAVVRNGELLRTAGYGWANLAERRAMTPDTLQNIASVTKTITCAAVMQLVERGRLALDEPIDRHLPFPVRNPAHPHVPLTSRQLLTHTSSVGDGPAYDASYACGDSRIPLGEWLRSYLVPGGAGYGAKSSFHPWPPGARYAYSNVAFGVLGYLIERMAGQSYSDYVLQHVFAPLGMARSRFLLTGMDSASHATPYSMVPTDELAGMALRDPAERIRAGDTVLDGRVQVPQCLYSFATPPDGLARTTATELARFMLAHMHGGEYGGARILGLQSVASIFSDQHVPRGRGEHSRCQGLAWHGSGCGSGATWAHSGRDPGVGTIMTFRAKDRTGVIVLTNQDWGKVPETIAYRILSLKG